MFLKFEQPAVTFNIGRKVTEHVEFFYAFMFLIFFFSLWFRQRAYTRTVYLTALILNTITLADYSECRNYTHHAECRYTVSTARIVMPIVVAKAQEPPYISAQNRRRQCSRLKKTLLNGKTNKKM